MDDKIYTLFCNSTKKIIKEMSGVEIRGMDSLNEEKSEINSLGISSIVTFAGGGKGRMLIDMEPSLAFFMANTILQEEYFDTKDSMLLSLVSEINNIISGDAITELNNNNNLDLRLAPPIVFSGQDVLVSIPKLLSKTSFGETDYGKIRINIAWEGGGI